MEQHITDQPAPAVLPSESEMAKMFDELDMDRNKFTQERKRFDEEKSQIEAHLFGVGMKLGMKDHKVVVIAPIEDTPASNAGIHPGDEII